MSAIETVRNLNSIFERYELELAQVQRWVVREGQATEIHVYVSREEALADTE